MPATSQPRSTAMQGDPQVIQHLQAQLRNELTATNQYFLHFRILKHWGFERLAKKEYEESIGEMKHADRLMERILTLDALPNLQDLGKLLIGENVREILDCDLKLEHAAIADLRNGIAHCETVRDFATRDMLIEMLQGEEEQVDFIETQIELINRTGIENYIQLQSGSAE
jgi:bacterioferritin